MVFSAGVVIAGHAMITVGASVSLASSVYDNGINTLSFVAIRTFVAKLCYYRSYSKWI